MLLAGHRAGTLAWSAWSQMSFQDDAVEPLAVESAQHFVEILRRAGAREEGEQYVDAGEPRERSEPRRALPRELGN